MIRKITSTIRTIGIFSLNVLAMQSYEVPPSINGVGNLYYASVKSLAYYCFWRRKKLYIFSVLTSHDDL